MRSRSATSIAGPSYVAVEADRCLRQRQKAALHRRDGHAGARMRVQYAGNVGPRFVNSAVDYVTGLVDVVVGIGLPDDVAVDVDLHQARGCDLLVEQAVEIDQEVVLGAGNARRDVVIDEVGHPVFVYQAVAGREFKPRLPFFVGYLAP